MSRLQTTPNTECLVPQITVLEFASYVRNGEKTFQMLTVKKNGERKKKTLERQTAGSQEKTFFHIYLKLAGHLLSAHHLGVSN